MATGTLTRPAAAEGMTEFFDGVACLDERVRRQAMPAPWEMPARPTEAGRYIGRGLAADLRLDEDSVSRSHAILVYRSSGSRILDDRSSNGTFVNGRRVTQADLKDGDVLVLGRVILRYLEV
jgi:hypothetical protein